MQSRGGHTRYQVDWGDRQQYVITSNLELVSETSDIFDLLENGHYGSLNNSRIAITHARLTGRLSDLIYSMEATNTDFYPFQFKPVLNLLESPSGGILVADEVGLGKTIEAGLIWTELRARFNAGRLIVLCPAVLREKWQEELGFRFGVEAQICSASGMLEVFEKYRTGRQRQFAVIASLQGLRPPRGWEKEPDSSEARTRLAHWLQAAESDSPLFDCAIFDEAHHMRNSESQTHKLGGLVRNASENVVLLSATPVHLRSTDLFNLLRIIDSETFQYPESFDEILEVNAPLLRLADRVRTASTSRDELLETARSCRTHELLHDNRQLKALLDDPPSDEQLAEPEYREALAAKIQRINLLSRVVNRTRKRDVQINRVVREPVAVGIPMNEPERRMYEIVTEIVRDYCAERDLNSAFIQTIPQRQMCSSMPAALKAWTHGSAGPQVDEMLFEDGGVVLDAPSQDDTRPLVERLSQELSGEVNYQSLYDDDSKYAALLFQLDRYFRAYPDNKVIVFSFYRGTLSYLLERLTNDGHAPELLVGGMRESKQEVIRRFRESPDKKILLASEVASEGVDLQFCSFLINYDLPWNPMRVEQRIGRIDRIGQKEQRIQIRNFFFEDTLDDRVYNRLFERLDIFRYSLGDLEAVLGEKIKSLTVDLLSHDLTPEQEADQIEQARLAIATNRRLQDELQDEAAHLSAHGDFILSKINDAQKLGRYIRGSDLLTYLQETLLEEFPGCRIVRVVDEPLTADITLSQDAKVELHHYLEQTKQFGTTGLVNSYVDHTVRCVFSSKVSFSDRRQEVVNQNHPLIRFVAGRVDSAQLHPLAAARVPSVAVEGIRPGTFLISTQIWSTTGAKPIEKLVYRGTSVEENADLLPEEAERLFNAMVSQGEDWMGASRTVESANALDGYERLLDEFDDEFEAYVSDMELENNDRVDFQIKSLETKINGQIARIRHVIDAAEASGDLRMVPANKGRIEKLIGFREFRRDVFERNRNNSTENRELTTVLVHVA